ncbi:MAG: WG repeat-containing protein [Flavobacterium sp.]|jgi:hypothetical protein
MNSCGTLRVNKTSDFKKNTNLDSLNGKYFSRPFLSKNTSNQDFFSLINKNNTKSDFLNLEFIDNNNLKISYDEIVENKLVYKEIILKGKRKKKFFEVYFSKKQFFIPILYGNFQIDRLRIGFDKSGKILIRNFYDGSGNILFIGGGFSGETKSLFEKVENSSTTIPFSKDSKWGFKKKNDTIIDPLYDFVRAFNGNCARISKNSKWGLIDNKGNYLSEMIYDSINPIITSNDDNFKHYFVYLNRKKGIINSTGKITVPVIYDEVKNNGEFLEMKIGDKFGFCNYENVIIPSIYSRLSSYIYHQYNYAEAERDNIIYYVDKIGYEYQTKPNPYYSKIGFLENGQPKYIPHLESKRKIEIEEQFKDFN